MNNKRQVALNMSKLSVSQKIVRARLIVDSVASNPGVFTNPNPAVSVAYSAINDLELAMQEAADGAKSKVALMHDKEADMMAKLTALAAYVQLVADGDEEVVHLAAMRYKQPPNRVDEDFEVNVPDDRGAVNLRCKARKKTLYRWEYKVENNPSRAWTVAITTDISNTTIGNLESQMPYWFRVVLLDKNGEHVLGPKCIVTL